MGGGRGCTRWGRQGGELGEFFLGPPPPPRVCWTGSVIAPLLPVLCARGSSRGGAGKVADVVPLAAGSETGPPALGRAQGRRAQAPGPSAPGGAGAEGAAQRHPHFPRR